MFCWFCSVRAAAPEHTWSTEMYGDVDTKKTTEQTQVFYNVRHIEVPRCSDCHSRHALALTTRIMAWIFLVLFAASLLLAFFKLVAPWIWGLGAGLSFGLLIAGLGMHFVSLKGIHSLKDAKTEFPLIKEYLEKSYRFGFRPKGHLPQDEPGRQDKDSQGQA